MARQMTENDANAAMGVCAALDFYKEPHCMRRDFPNGHAIAVYKLAPVSPKAPFAMVIQHHKGPGDPHSVMTTDPEKFRIELTTFVASETENQQ